MDSLEDAERCIKYLNRSILEGRVISVEKKFRLNYTGIKAAALSQLQHLRAFQLNQHEQITNLIRL
jgi:hypothetical protein